jgi:hypothetical protein
MSATRVRTRRRRRAGVECSGGQTIDRARDPLGGGAAVRRAPDAPATALAQLVEPPRASACAASWARNRLGSSGFRIWLTLERGVVEARRRYDDALVLELTGSAGDCRARCRPRRRGGRA